MQLHLDGAGQVIRIEGLVPAFATYDGQPVVSLLSTIFSRPLNQLEEETIREALLLVDTSKIAARYRRFFSWTVEFPEERGEAMVVTTTPDDRIEWGKRRRRERPSRFVLNRRPMPSKHLTVVLEQLPPVVDLFYLTACYFGTEVEPEPDDWRFIRRRPMRRETRGRIYQRARVFWESHAFVYGWCPDLFVSEMSPTKPDGWDNAHEDSPHRPGCHNPSAC